MTEFESASIPFVGQFELSEQVLLQIKEVLS